MIFVKNIFVVLCIFLLHIFVHIYAICTWHDTTFKIIYVNFHGIALTISRPNLPLSLYLDKYINFPPAYTMSNLLLLQCINKRSTTWLPTFHYVNNCVKNKKSIQSQAHVHYFVLFTVKLYMIMHLYILFSFYWM